MSRIALAMVLLSGLFASCAGPAKLLPHTLYYLAGPREQSQVWRLEADGSAKAQITTEEAGVQEFAVSPADGSLALVSNNQLFLVDGRGENRRLIADDSQVDQNIEDYAFRSLVGSPVFSTDGQTLAYAFDGLHLYDISKGKDEHVLTNLGNLQGESFVFSRESYSPGPWSPDGHKLLIIMSYYEGSTLAVMEPGAAQPFTRMRSNGPVCCQFSWTEDSRSVLVANPNYTGDRPGLWKYDAETGKESVLIMGPNDGSSNDFVGWPHQPDSGELLYFHVNLKHFSPDTGIPLTMVRSNPDGSNRTQLRPEAFDTSEVLWAPNGSFALAVQRASGDNQQIVLARTDASPLQVLVEGQRIGNLAWGP